MTPAERQHIRALATAEAAEHPPEFTAAQWDRVGALWAAGLAQVRKSSSGEKERPSAA